MKAFRYPFVLLALVCVAFANAQEISFTASVDRTSIAVGEQIQLTLNLTNGGDRFEAPDLGGLVIVGGPRGGSSVNILNGRMNSSATRTWWLTATAPGKYTIGSSKVRIGNATIATDPITIEVVKGDQSGTGTQTQQQRTNSNIFATMDLSRSKAYVGEQVMLTYTLFTRYGQLEPVGNEVPALNGFWSEDIDLGQVALNQVVTVNGIQYYKAVIKKQLLIPQRSGKLRIAPAKFSFRASTGMFFQSAKVEAIANAVEFNAIALPPNAPADFNGSVGELEMTAHADRTSVKANEAIELTVHVSGRSNLKLLEAPKLEFPSDFETYDPKVVDKISIGAGGMSGSREFQYTIIPRHDGHFDLGPVSFSYFDISSGNYRSLSSAPIVFDVAPGEGGRTADVQRPSKSDVETLGEDVRYIRTGNLELREKDHYLFASLSWFAGMGAPALGFVIFLGWHRRRERHRGDVEGTRRKRAERMARNRLREAEQALQKNDRSAFYTSLAKALHGYLSDKFNLGVAEVNTSELKQRFASYAGGDELAETSARLLGTCDMARFAPVEDKPRKELYDDAVQLIQRIERATQA